VRGEVLSVKQRDFILATQSIGARDGRLIVRHSANVLPVLIVAASLGVGQIILIEAALDFLGLAFSRPRRAGATCSPLQSYSSIRCGWCISGDHNLRDVLAANLFGKPSRRFRPRLK